MRVLVIGLACWFVLGCSVDKSVELNSERFRFSNVFAATISPKCVSCHDAKRADAGMRFDTHEFLLQSGSIVPGNAGASSFCQVLVEQSLPSTKSVSAEETIAVCGWIQNGALDD